LVKENDRDLTDFILKVKDKSESVPNFMQRIDAVAGTPEVILRKMREYVDIGIEEFVIHFISLDKKSLELMYSKVIRDF
jgi:hypothetical protein